MEVVDDGPAVPHGLHDGALGGLFDEHVGAHEPEHVEAVVVGGADGGGRVARGERLVVEVAHLGPPAVAVVEVRERVHDFEGVQLTEDRAERRAEAPEGVRADGDAAACVDVGDDAGDGLVPVDALLDADGVDVDGAGGDLLADEDEGAAGQAAVAPSDLPREHEVVLGDGDRVEPVPPGEGDDVDGGEQPVAEAGVGVEVHLEHAPGPPVDGRPLRGGVERGPPYDGGHDERGAGEPGAAHATVRNRGWSCTAASSQETSTPKKQA